MDINLELMRYAGGFTYFLLKQLKKSQIERVNTIILFGSVSQERAGKDSDVDLFVDVSLPPFSIRQLRSGILKEREKFLLSNEGLTYKAKGIYNELRVIVGNLSEWHEMKKSISSSGIVLYGQYRAAFARKGLKHAVIFFWEGEGRNRGALLNKLYGYKVKGKRYKGAIERFSGTKIGKSASLIPTMNSRKFMDILEHYGVNYKTKEVFI